MNRTLLALIVVLVAVLQSGAVYAQSDAAPAAAGAAPYKSPIRERCSAEMERDPYWRAAIEESLLHTVHKNAINSMMTNKKHVVMAYAGLLILLVVFIVLLYLRQARLVRELGKLGADISALEQE